MTDPIKSLTSIRRPRLLVRAARFGLAEYRRERDLGRLIGKTSAPTPAQAVAELVSEEARTEQTRRAGDATYSVARHVELLIALMGEFRLLQKGPGAAG